MGKQNGTKGVTLAAWGGDHGTGTPAAKRGTRLEEMLTEDGRNPNRMARRRRVNRIEQMMKQGQLEMRQYQAALAIQEAWCRVETLSSGGELKEYVQASPKPDAVTAKQVDAATRLKQVMDPVPGAMRYVVEHVCWHNEPLASLPRGSRHGCHSANLKVALHLVANRLQC